jgi:hypothetical protein
MGGKQWQVTEDGDSPKRCSCELGKEECGGLLEEDDDGTRPRRTAVGVAFPASSSRRAERPIEGDLDLVPHLAGFSTILLPIRWLDV